MPLKYLAGELDVSDCVCVCVCQRERRECLSGRVQVSWDNFVVDVVVMHIYRVSPSLFQLFQSEQRRMCMFFSGFAIFLGPHNDSQT